MFLEKDQYGFRKGRGTRDAIAALQVMYERSLEHHKKVYVCYIDFEKAFDRVNRLLQVDVNSAKHGSRLEG